ncbi:hypothetical protein [Novosphingobium album (ex Liu et al. 2023)]|uniref:Uncharacterized protein n=1 Tax=Novosphingobium album (ex Liu et al. 2023) TaxID=3031130 RepID=A0ABT5WXE9_9SPHN|nr:hypothetical protein [Novosphingobium album (ex Liu et al. 2023)]MDE8654557.1 hypothetical protein [Novosphingobium album (ex Liu et al. 2023)]
MKRIAFAALATATVAAALLSAPSLQAREKLTGEQKLAKMLEGREAGKPLSCIPLFDTRDLKVIDKTAIVYGSGKTIYVNRPTNADTLDSDDVLVTELHSSQLCRLDTVRMHDRSSHFFSGFVGLNDFVPYTKVAAKH